MRLFVPGDRVSQAQYGHGTVTRADEYHTSIDFDDHGLRTFSSTRSHLERSDTTAPVKPAKKRMKKALKTAVAVS